MFSKGVATGIPDPGTFVTLLTPIANFFSISFGVASIGLLFSISFLHLETNGFLRKSAINNLNSEFKSTLFNMSVCLLKLKDLTKGFQLYETRWVKNNAEEKKYTNIPLATDILQIFNKKICLIKK